MAKNAPLSVKIDGDQLVISMGISTLGFAATRGPYFDDVVAVADGEEVKITDEDAFADAIVSELCREEEDGTTLVHRMFDKAAENAVENGCDGIELPAPIDGEEAE